MRESPLETLYAGALEASVQGDWATSLRLSSEILNLDPLHSGAGNLLGTALRMLRVESGDDAKFKLLSVLFVDIGASSRLTTILGPERWRKHLLAIQSVIARAIARYEGYVHNYEGDAVLASFSFPRTHEDDARRAVLCALAIISDSRDVADVVNNEVSKLGGSDRFSIRVGIDSGRVVVGPTGSLPSINAADLVGEAANFAARLQHQALRTGVAVSSRTHDLIQGYFVTEPDGPVVLRGFAPQVIHHIIGSTGVEDRLQATSHRTPLVGRLSHRAALEAAWEDALSGGRPVVVLHGEAGAGKSRLAEFVADLARAGNRPVLELRCSALLRSSAFGPIGEVLNRLLRLDRAERPLTIAAVEQQLGELSGGTIASWIPEIIARLVGVDVQTSLLPDVLRARSIHAIVELFRAAVLAGPLLLLVEDVHEADPSTRAVLARLQEDEDLAGFLTVVTSRDEPEPSTGEHRSIEVGPLDVQESRELVSSLLLDLETTSIETLAATCDGIPLFAEELCLRGYAADRRVPVTLEAVLVTRLDALEGDPERVAEAMAVVGQETDEELLSELVGLRRERLERALHTLLSHRVIVVLPDVPMPRYRFRHGLVQSVAYDRLLEVARVGLHRRCASVLTGRISNGGAVLPELLAEHLTAAGDEALALPWWRRAGERAAAMAAHTEAATHFERALHIVQRLQQDTELLLEEFEICLHLGLSRSAAHGYGSEAALAAFTRAHELTAQMPRSPVLLPALWGVWSFHFIRGDLRRADSLAGECVLLASDGDDNETALAAAVLGTQRLFEGRFAEAARALRHGRAAVGGAALLIPQNPSLASQCQLAIAQWHLGRTLDARRQMDAAVASAVSDSSSRAEFTRAFVFCFAAWLHQLCLEHDDALEMAARAEHVADRHQFLIWLLAARMHVASANVMVGNASEAVAALRAGLQIWQSLGGAQLMVPYYLAQLGWAELSLGEVTAAAKTAADGLVVGEQGEQRFHEVELLRLRARISLSLGESTIDSNQELRHAAEVAVMQGAASLRLRILLDCAVAGQVDPLGGHPAIRAAIDDLDADDRNRDRSRARAFLAEHADSTRSPF